MSLTFVEMSKLAVEMLILGVEMNQDQSTQVDFFTETVKNPINGYDEGFFVVAMN